MAERTQPQESSQPSDRIQKYRAEVQSLVKQGGEQPCFEFKRTASLKRQNLEDRFSFIKLLQGLANAEIGGERCIIIGADPKEKEFFPVANPEEFDAANISQVLTSYVEPLPLFNVFQVTTEDEQPFVLIVLEANQPRPIFITKEGHSAEGKERLQVGDVWIKKNTGLVRATRADMDLMYEAKVEKEAEDRARKRLQHLLEISPSQHQAKSASRAPDFKLLVGPKNDLRAFAEELIAAGEVRRLLMVVEMAREPLIDGWNNLNVRAGTTPQNISEFLKEVANFFRDQFLPSLQSIVELAAIGIRYQTNVDAWLSPLMDLLLDVFDSSRGLNWLKSQYVLQQADSIKWWQPGFEVFIAIRTVALYAVARRRWAYLGKILPTCVTPITIDDRQAHKTPILFWPFRGVEFQEFAQGRSSYYWKARVASSCGKLFGTLANFLNASSQLEFLLELNSYFGNNIPASPDLQKFLAEHFSDVSFNYQPDLYSQDLQATVAMAEVLYDVFSSNQAFPTYLAVDARMFDRVLANLQPTARLQTYAGFLSHLRKWQSEYMFQVLHRHPFFYDWQGRLEKIVVEYRNKQRQQRNT